MPIDVIFEHFLSRPANNYRYHDLIERFALALYILGGRYTYEFVRLNLPCALPCPTKINSLINESNLKLNEAEFRFDYLQEYLKSKDISYGFASEDSTAILKKISYDCKTNSFIGFCTPLNNGIPIPQFFRTESFSQLKLWFENVQKASYLNLQAVQPIAKSVSNISPLLLGAYGINNNFTLYDIVRKWVYIFTECLSRHIQIVGFAAGNSFSNFTNLLQYLRLDFCRNMQEVFCLFLSSDKPVAIISSFCLK